MTHNHDRDGITRKSLFVGAAGVSAAGLIAACDSDDESTSASSEQANAGGGPKRKVIWALAAIAEWNLQIDVGFIEATRMLGWDYQKVGVPISQYSPESVVNVVNRAAAARPDILVTPAWVPGVANATRRAQENDILVLYNNANNIVEQAEELGVAYIGADEYRGGLSVGQPLCEAVVKNGKRSGTVVAGIGFAGNENLENRARGATDAIDDYNQAKGTNFRVERFIDKSGEGQEETLTAYKTKMRETGDDLVGFMTPGGDASLAGLLPALQEEGREPGEVPIVGWDVSTRANQAVADGWVTAVVDKQDYVTGFLPVFMAWAEIERGFKARDYDTGGVVVDASNVEESMKRESTLKEKAEEFDVRLS